MTSPQRRLWPIVLPSALALILTSCPLPINEHLIANIEDGLKPQITVDNYENGDTFYSKLSITGTISDDSLALGDRKGTLNYLSVNAGSGYLYNGGIFIDALGKTKADPDLGSAGVSYTMSTGAYTITMDTHKLDQDIVVKITAIDTNGNSTTKNLELNASEGPVVNIIEPASSLITEGASILLKGTISDSKGEPGSIKEIDTVSFYINTLAPTPATMKLSDPDSKTPSGYGMSVAWVDAAEKFSLDGNVFKFEFSPPDTGMGDSPTITIKAVDKNGNEGEDSRTLVKGQGGPSIVVKEPKKLGNYYSSKKDHPATIKFKATVTSSSSDVTSVKIIATDDDKPRIFTLYSERYPGSLSHEHTIDLSPYTGNLTLKLEAEDVQGTSATVIRNVLDDRAGPTFEDFSFVSSKGNPGYARAGDEVTMRFKVSDSGAGVDFSTLEISDSNEDFASELKENTDGSFGLKFKFPTDTPAYPDGLVPYTLTVQDKVTNETTQNQDDQKNIGLIYYHKAPDSSPSVKVVKTSDLSRSDPSYLRAGESIKATFSLGQELDLTSSKFYFTLDDGTKKAGNITKSDSGKYESEEYEVTDKDAEGAVGWEMDYVDSAGNTAQFESRTKSFTIDRTPPKISDSTFLTNHIANDQKVLPSGSYGEVSFSVTDPQSVTDDQSGLTNKDEYKKVKFLIDGVLFKTASLTESGNTFSSRTPILDSDTPQGKMTAVVEVYDRAGNMLSQLVSGSLTVDTQGPGFSSTAPTVRSSGQAIDKAGIGDTITMTFTLDEAQKTDTTPTVTLSVPRTSDSTLVDIDVSDVKPSDQATWTATYVVPEPAPDALTTGAVTLGVVAQDKFGNRETLSHAYKTFILDNVKPAFSSTPTFTSDAKVSGSATMAGIGDTITMEFTLNKRQRTGTKPTVSLNIPGTPDAISVAENDVNSDDGITWTATYTVPDSAIGSSLTLTGSMTLEVTAQDEFGNSKTLSHANNTLTVDNVKPAFSSTSTPTFTSDAKVSGSVTRAGVGDTITMTFTLDEAQKAGTKPTVALSVPRTSDSTLVDIDVSDVKSSDQTTWTATYTVPDSTGGGALTLTGSVTLKVTAQDEFGNSDTLSHANNTLTVDNAKPAFSSTPTFTSDAKVSGSATKAGIGDTITMTFTLDEAQKTRTKPTVTLSIPNIFDPTPVDIDISDIKSSDQTTWTATYLVPDPLATVDAPTLAGAVTLKVAAEDQFGNSDVLSRSDAFTVDNVRPNHGIPSFNPRSGLSQNDIIEMRVRTSSVDVDSVTFHLNNVDHDAIWDNINKWWSNNSVTLPAVAGGFNVTVTVVDGHGNTDKDSNSQLLTIAPSVSVAKTSSRTPSDASYLRAGESIKATFSLGQELDLTSSKFYFTLDDGTEKAVNITKSVSGSYESEEYTVTAVDAEGAVGWEMDYVDSVGKRAQFSGSTSFTIDRTPPKISSSTFLSNHIANNQVVPSGSYGEVSFSVTDAQSGLTNTDKEVKFSIADVLFDTVSSTESGNTFSSRTPTLNSKTRQGKMTAVVEVYDRAGNMLSHPVSDFLTVDTLGPDFSSTTPTITSSGQASDKAGIGDTITMTFTLDEAQKDSTKPTVSLNSMPVPEINVISNDQMTWTAEYRVPDSTTGGVPALTGTVTVEVVGQDEFGNRKTLNHTYSIFTVDNVKPAFSSTSTPTFTSDAQVSGSATKAGIGDTITMRFTLNEAQRFGTEPTVTLGAPNIATSIAVSNVKIVDPSDGMTWEATYQVEDAAKAGVPDFTAAFVTLEVTATDDFGNSGTLKHSNDTFTVDNVKPAFSSTPTFTSDAKVSGSAAKAGIGDTITMKFILNEAQKTGTKPTVTLNTMPIDNKDVQSSDQISWTATYMVEDLTTGGVPTLTRAIATLKVTAEDQFGNKESHIQNSVLTIDNDRPKHATPTFKPDMPDLEEGTTLEIRVKSSSSDVDSVTFYLDSDDHVATWDENNAEWLAIIPLNTQGSFNVTVTVSDHYGNTDNNPFNKLITVTSSTNPKP